MLFSFVYLVVCLAFGSMCCTTTINNNNTTTAINREFSSDVSPDFEVVIVKASVVLHNFVCKRDGYTFEDALTVTGLEDVPDGQSVRGGLTANSVRNKVADYFLTVAGAAS